MEKRLRPFPHGEASYILLTWTGAEHKNMEACMELLSEKRLDETITVLIRLRLTVPVRVVFHTALDSNAETLPF